MADVNEPYVPDCTLPEGAVPTAGLNMLAYLRDDGQPRFTYEKSEESMASELIGMLMMVVVEIAVEAATHDDD